MKFPEAMALVLAGRKVRRPNWLPGHHLKLRDRNIYYCDGYTNNFPTTSLSGEVIHSDWEEFEPKYEFVSDYHYVGCLPAFDQKVVKDEPMLFRADLKYALEYGGPITRNFIEGLSKLYTTNKSLLIDSRVHMLFPGMYPCIPGWHHDSVERNVDGKPNYDNPSYRALHILAVVGDASLTEFAVGTASFPVPKPHEIAYGLWHPLVDEAIKDGKLKKEVVAEGGMYEFDDRAWHQGVAATKRGFRLFIRATIGTTVKAANEVRTNSQVYLTNPFQGW